MCARKRVNTSGQATEPLTADRSGQLGTYPQNGNSGRSVVPVRSTSIVSGTAIAGTRAGMSIHDIGPTPVALISNPPVDAWPCLTCGLLVINPEIHQEWVGAGDLKELDKRELHETIAEQRGVSTEVTE